MQGREGASSCSDLITSYRFSQRIAIHMYKFTIRKSFARMQQRQYTMVEGRGLEPLDIDLKREVRTSSATGNPEIPSHLVDLAYSTRAPTKITSAPLHQQFSKDLEIVVNKPIYCTSTRTGILIQDIGRTQEKCHDQTLSTGARSEPSTSKR